MQLTASNVRLVAIVLTALCAVSGGIYLVFCKRKDYRRAFAYKGTAGLCFVVLGLLGTDANIRSMLGTGGARPSGGVACCGRTHLRSARRSAACAALYMRE